jgi:hypothetical protein
MVIFLILETLFLDWQQTRFVEFKQLLQEPALASKILYNWSLEDWPGLNPDETQLMSLESGLMLWQIYALLPDVVKEDSINQPLVPGGKVTLIVMIGVALGMMIRQIL